MPEGSLDCFAIPVGKDGAEVPPAAAVAPPAAGLEPAAAGEVVVGDSGAGVVCGFGTDSDPDGPPGLGAAALAMAWMPAEPDL